MGKRIEVNKEVAVTALYFKNDRELAGYPKRIELDGREYTFMDGLRYLVHKGQQLIQVFDMTDGSNEYRLQFDSSRKSWMLVDITASGSAA